MREARVTPGEECSIPQASGPAIKPQPVRKISQAEQEALERMPFFENFGTWLYRLAQKEISKGDTPRPPEAA